MNKVQIPGLPIAEARKIKKAARQTEPIAKVEPKELPKLEVYRKPFYQVSHIALESFIKARFGFEYDMKFALGMADGETIEYRVDGILHSNELKAQADKLRAGNRTRNVGLILNCLASWKEIPSGFYTVVVVPPPPPPMEIYRQLLANAGSTKAPECIAFVEQHRDNAAFMRGVETINCDLAKQAA
jgi:hypothetical protein